MNLNSTRLPKFPKHFFLSHLKLVTLVLLFSLMTGRLSGQTSWYSYQSGEWTDWRTWTTDPSGTTLINPASTTPSSALNNSIVILNGRTVIIADAVPAITTTSFTIQEGAVLDLTTNTNAHSFGIFSGSGLLRLSTATFPAFASGTFVLTGGGTVEYRNLAGFQFQQVTYNNLILNLNNKTDEALFITTTSPLTINGNLTVEKGIFRINDNSNTIALNVSIKGNVTVNENGQIGIGNINVGSAANTGGRSHQVTIAGDLNNNGGTVKFTNMTAPVYNADPTGGAQAGWSDVIFNNGTRDQFVVCNGPTVFYRIQVSKGTDQTYVLNIDADNSARFQLMGRNERTAYNPGTPPNLPNLNAIGLLSGTVRFGPNIVIPSLATDAFVVDGDAGLWIDGANVTMLSSKAYSALFTYGTVRFSSTCQASIIGQIGMVIRESGNLIIENGTIVTRSVRTSVLGNPGLHRGAFKMYGGSLTLASCDISEASDYHATFAIAYPQNVFIMSGGTIDIQVPYVDAGGGSVPATNFSLMLGSLPKNVEVTGGTIRIKTTTRPAYMNSTVPLPNLEIYGTANTFQVRGIALAGSNLANPLPLVVLQNLTIQNTANFNNSQNVNVLVGGNFNILSGTTYTPGINTTLFNGTGSQMLDIQGTIAGNLNNLTLSNASVLTVNNAGIATPVIVNGNLRLDPGCTLNDNGRIIEVRGNITNSGTHFKPVTGAGSIQLTGTNNQVINGSGSGKFNNLTLNKNGGTVSLQSNMIVTGDLRLANSSARLNIGTFNLLLTATGDVYDNLSGTGRIFDRNRMIQTAGLMSDGGVSKVFSNTGAYLFPFGFFNGTTYYYMPASLRYSSAPTVYGMVTSRPVNAPHPLAQAGNSLACYWKTSESGFSGVSAGSVIHKYTYDPLSNDFVGGGTEASYIPAVFRNNASNSWISVNNPVLVNEGTNTVTYDTAFTANGEYTAGEPASFSSVPVLYSTGTDGDWSHAATWSAVAVGGPAGTSVPDGNTIVVIGDATHNHTVFINQNGKVCGNLAIYPNSVLDLKNFTGHNFGALPERGVTGYGTLRIASNNYFPQGDLGEFIGENGGTVEYYTLTGTSITMPLTSDLTGLVLSHYCNLKMSPVSGTHVGFPDSDLTIYSDLTKSEAGDAITNTQAKHTIQVNHNLNVAAGKFLFQNAFIQTVKVLGNLIVNGSFTVVNSVPAVSHILELSGSLSGTGTFDANVTNGRILTCFKGSADASISGAAKDFYSLEVDKGSDQSPVLNLRSDITTLIDPAVTLKNGTFRIKQSTFNLSTNRSFSIPETGCLSIDSLANITISNNNTYDSTLFLSGKLEILAGTLNVGNAGSARRNCIEYSSDGVPTIYMSGGTLNVYGQIKRNSQTTQGSLRYSQSGGVLNVFGRASDNTRAKFEICNDNSSFAFGGGIINIYRGAGVDFGDIYLRPSLSSVTGGTINLGPGSALIPSQIYNLDATCNLHNLFVTGFSSGNTATARIMVNQLTLTGDLNIGASSSALNCNNKNVFIAGNFTNNGTYNAGTNTTTFNGGNTQTASFGVNTLFKNVVIDKTPGTAITFSSPGASQPTISDTLSITQGTLTNAGNLNIILQGDLINNGIHSSTGAGSLLIQGTRNQVISGNNSGQLGNVMLDNGAGNGATLAADATINGVLTLTTGYLYINDFLLTLASTSSVSGVTGNTANHNWIISNGVLSDGGVKKIYPAISGTSFTFPMGMAGKYTPVTYAVNFGTPGSITLKPVNNKIPSLTDILANELQYYWNVSSSGFAGMTSATHTYSYLQSDVTGNEANYVGAKYFANTWTNLGSAAINTGSNTITFTQNYIDGEYTCGEPPNFLTKPVYYSYNFAPDITTTGADWNTAGSWATGGHAGTVVTVPPDGNPVIIAPGHRINIANDDRLAYSIQNEGILNLDNKIGHNFGHVSGAGRIIISNTGAGQFVYPGGDYTVFMNTEGSTIEYNGASGVLSNISPIIRTYQNLEFTGPVSKTMSSTNILVKGNLLISGSPLINSVYNKSIVLWGNWNDVVSSGFIPGTGMVSLDGNTLQTINSSGPELFSKLRINNPAGVTLSGSAEVSGWLYLANGRINTTDVNLLTITSNLANPVTGGSDSSFVDGPLSKLIITGQSFNFPVGNFNGASAIPSRYGNILVSGVNATGYWKAQYFNSDPDGIYRRSNLLPPITSVSNNEYWIVNRPGANTANIRLRWDAASAIASVASTRVTEWVTNRWEEKGSDVSGSISSGTVSTTTPVTTNDFVFTLGVSGVTARINNVSPATICNNGEVVTVSVTLTGTPNWTLTYLAGMNSFTQSGIGSGTYAIQLTGADLGGPGAWNIQLTAVSDGTGQGVVDPAVFPVIVKSTHIPDIQGTFTVGAAEVRNFNTAGNAGSSYAWSWLGADGGIISSPATNSTDVSITTPGAFPAVYQLQVDETSTNGCVARDVQGITVLDAPSPVISPATANQCQGNVVNYSTPHIGTHTYAWTVVGGIPASGTGNTLSVTWNTVGNGSITVVENNAGLTGTAVVNVVVDPNPSVGLAVSGPPSVCYDNIAVISVAGSEPGFSYQLREDAVPTGSASAGTGGNITLSSMLLTSSATFNVLAYNNGCSSQLTQTVTVNVSDPAAPTGSAFQSFCGINDPTIANLNAGGNGIQWYSSGVGGTPLPAATALSDDSTYYASQTIDGCESNLRLAVTVVTGNDPVPVVVIESAERCGPGSIDIEATATDADRVDFSLDGGLTTTATDSSAPYVFTVNLATSETLHIMGKAYNTVSGCSGAWEGDALVVANVVPVPEKIVSSNIDIEIPGYIDVVCSGQQNVMYHVNASSNATYNWNVPGLGISANGVTEIEIDWNVPGGDYRIELEKVSDKNCSAKGDTMVLVSQPEPDLGPDVANCEGNSHTFSLPEYYDNYKWNDGSTDPTLTASASGQVYVTVWDEYQCTGSDTASLFISTSPVVDLGKDTVICGSNSLELDAGDFARYSWSTGETVNPVTVREGAGTVSVIVTNDGGCEGRDEILIKPCDPRALLGVISNVITPNDDNVHDTWMISNIYQFPEASIQIFDRWGRVVFEQNGGYENDWEGKDSSGKDLPVDTYFYVIDLKVKGNPPISGNVTIIR